MRFDRKQLINSEQLSRILTRIAHEILERNYNVDRLALVGIRTRGEYLARRLAEKCSQIEGKSFPLGVVDVTLYRDDLSHSAEQPIVRGTDLPFNVDKSTILLVDDVLFTGRTTRAAIDAIIDFGRPKSIQLVVLIDRGHRELPFSPNYTGKNLHTSRKEEVDVMLTETDGSDGVFIRQVHR